jgi:uncharacterized protein YidB (DUF937 family)
MMVRAADCAKGREPLIGLFDGLVGDVLESLQGGGPQGQIGDEHTNVATNLLEMLGGGQAHGLGGLVQSFERAGLGHLIQGWISTGPNPPGTAEQIRQGLGQSNLQSLAQKTGLSVSALLPLLVQVLPVLIDKMTPDGRIPAQAAGGQSGLGGLLGGALGGLFGRKT